MGGRLTTPPSSSTTAHRTLASNSTNTSHQRRRSSSNHHHHHHQQHSSPHGLFGPNPASIHSQRARTTSTNLDPLNPTPFNLNLLRYVGLEHESDDQTSDEDSPQTHRRLQRIFLALRDVSCPVCHKMVPSDSLDKHILQCLSKPRIDYNEDTLTEDKGECVICLDDLLVGQKIARLPCLCIYHKHCIDNWFRINQSCPEHPGD